MILNTAFRDSIARAFSFFGRSLLEILPVKLRPYFQYTTPAFIINLDAETELEQALKELPIGSELRFELDASLVLKKDLEFPKAAKSDLSKAVQLEIDRIAPLQADKLAISFRAVGFYKDEKILVRSGILRKEKLQNILKAASVLGHHVSAVLASEENAETLQFSHSAISRRKLLRASLVIGSVISSIYLLSLFPGRYHDKINAEIEVLDQQILETRRQTEKIAGLQRQMRALQDLSEAVLVERKKANVVEIFAQLSDDSPDDVSFDLLRIDGDRVFLSGTAVAPENWVIELAKSPAFQNVVLASVRGQEGEAARHFEVRLNLVWQHMREDQL